MTRYAKPVELYNFQFANSKVVQFLTLCKEESAYVGKLLIQFICKFNFVKSKNQETSENS